MGLSRYQALAKRCLLLIGVTTYPLFMSGCATGLWQETDSYNPNAVDVMVLKAEDRAIIAHPITTTTAVTTSTVASTKSETITTTTKVRHICAEPSPDADSSILATVSATYGKGSTVTADIAAAMSNNVQNISVRTVALEMVREMRYGVCEEAANGKLDEPETRNLMRRILDSMVVLLSIEQLTKQKDGQDIAKEVGQPIPVDTPLTMSVGGSVYLKPKVDYKTKDGTDILFKDKTLAHLGKPLLGKLGKATRYPMPVETPVTTLQKTEVWIPVGTSYYLKSDGPSKIKTFASNTFIEIDGNASLLSASGGVFDFGGIKSETSVSVVSAVDNIVRDYLKKDDIDQFIYGCKNNDPTKFTACFNSLIATEPMQNTDQVGNASESGHADIGGQFANIWLQSLVKGGVAGTGFKERIKDECALIPKWKHIGRPLSQSLKKLEPVCKNLKFIP
ncbi:hypothetical protein [Mangrovitalea sediminis]|uniref:hypothetical protein n=1 Tax=Mangrovitalea sediminis TaxID=1982043 RepID=UPI000BE54A77|nr:hypothetical protein [Mangrovitalea sediminis]